MTAHNLEDERERCLSAGMKDLVAKPTNAAQLADCLKR